MVEHSLPLQTAPATARPVPYRSGYRVAEILLLVALLGLGLGLRLLKLTDPPLDFHPTRQLRAAIIARGMYYSYLPDSNPQRQAAIAIWSTMEAYEPPILERIVSLTYLAMGGEHLWVSRVYTGLFWLVGGLALYGLVRRALSPVSAILTLAFYLILPWGVQASRSFQPDPWMVMWILLAAYSMYRWSEKDFTSWVWTLLSAVFSAMAVLVKAYAVFPVAGMLLGLLLSYVLERGRPWKNILALARRPQLWVYACLAVLSGIYYLGLGSRSASFASFWILSFSGMLKDSKFYVRWLGLIRGIMDVMVFFAALLGSFLYMRRARALVLGLWAGYFLTGATFPFQIYTHDYYSIFLVPLAALGLAPIFEGCLARLRPQPVFWRIVFTLALLAVAGYYAWVARSQLYAQQYLVSEPYPWQQMGKTLPREGSIIALTHDYGDRLKYYGWRTVNRLWPSQGDLDLSAAAGGNAIGDFMPYFQQQTAGMDYFLVTLFADLDAQPALKSMLYDHYPIAQKGDGYVLFDLRHPNP